MSNTSADLVKGWQAECARLEQKFAFLKVEGHSPSGGEIQALVTLNSLIADFGRHESFSILLEKPEPRVHRTIQLRLERRWTAAVEAAAA